ncbi:MAG: GHMP family kinase ATP-binding protein [Candidatus Thorarchaeota archaeon]|jgi:galactokinase
MERFSVRAPGRICLFGEHSDYLGLDVIPAAIDLAIEIRCSRRDDMKVNVNYLDLDEEDSFKSDDDVAYRHKRDYLRSAFNIVKRRGMILKNGWDLEVSGNIPIAAGLSSSSALTVAAVHAFLQMSESDLPPQEVAQLAYEAEVREFGESGGVMDHFSSAFGGIIHVDLGAHYKTTRLPAKVEGLVIGDSLEKKEDTVADLKRIRSSIEKEYQTLSEIIPDFNQRTTPTLAVSKVSPEVLTEARNMAETTLHNRDLTRLAFELLMKENPNPNEVGRLLDQHHDLLRLGLKRSTRKIEGMIVAAKSAGALGCKINGSGGGGTMLALAPGNENEVANAIRDAGGKPYRVSIGSGAQIVED